MRPVIGMTLDDEHGRPGVHVLRDDYVRSVEQAEAIPLVIAPTRSQDAGPLLDRLDGLLLTGGIDVDPELFDQPPHPNGSIAGGTIWRSPSSTRRWPGTSPSSLSAGEYRC